MTAVLSSAAADPSHSSLNGANGANIFHPSNVSLDSQHSLGGNDGMAVFAAARSR